MSYPRQLRDRIPDPGDDPDGTLGHGMVQWILDTLPDGEQRVVVELRLGLNGSPDAKTLRQVGDELGLSRERVLQVELHARRALKTLIPSPD